MVRRHQHSLLSLLLIQVGFPTDHNDSDFTTDHNDSDFITDHNDSDCIDNNAFFKYTDSKSDPLRESVTGDKKLNNLESDVSGLIYLKKDFLNNPMIGYLNINNLGNKVNYLHEVFLKCPIDIVHSVHWGINPPPSKTLLPSFLPNPAPSNQQIVQAHPF